MTDQVDHNSSSNDDVPGKGGTPDAKAADIQALVDEQLKDIKGKLDKAYGARDAALAKVAEHEQRLREAELARLKEEGKHKEAYEMQLAEEKARREAVEKKNIELTRDIDLRNALSGLTFRNEHAAGMAFRELVQELIRDEKGEWVHKSGIPIREAVQKFAENEENAFLFKQKVNSGSGNSSPSGTPDSGSKPLYKQTQAEVLALARQGKLPNQKRG